MFHIKHKNRPFTTEEWILNREFRIHIVKDLIDNEYLLGKSKLAVLQFLGDEFNDINSNTWSFYLGYKYKFINFKKQQLNVSFNGEGKVENTFINQ